MTQKKKNLMGRHSLSCNFAGSWLVFGFLKNAVQPRLTFYLMSSNRHKTTMCYVCGKVMRGDKSKKHGWMSNIAPSGNGCQESGSLTIDEILKMK